MKNFKTFESFVNEKSESGFKPGDEVKVVKVSALDTKAKKFIGKTGKVLRVSGNDVYVKLKGFKSPEIEFSTFELALKESVNESSFYRLSKDIIGNELYRTSKNLQNLYTSVNNGNDIDPGVVDSIIKNLQKIKKSIKKFNSPEEIKGTDFE